MKNTKEESKRRMYIVSFGDSRKYRILVDSEDNENALKPVVDTENELNRFLAREFPGETFAYYTTPRVTEVNPEHADKYASYPPLDSRAIEDVKDVLIREIEVMNSDRELNSNDAWGATRP